ncbi:MAG: hypothetical protein ABEJ04_05740 [Halobacteriaceae archaeon]
MAESNESSVVSFDAAGALAAARGVAGEAVRVCVEYDDESFRVLHVGDEVAAVYGDEEAMYDHFEEIHSYVHVDFTEKELFTDTLFPVADGVEYMVTGMDAFTLLRVYVGDEGLFFSLDPGTAVVPLVEAVRDALE